MTMRRITSNFLQYSNKILGSRLSCRYSNFSQKFQRISDLQLFLQEIGPCSREARYWLKEFQRLANEDQPFAIVHIDDEVFLDSLSMECLLKSLAYLKRLEIKFVLVLAGLSNINSSELVTVLRSGIEQDVQLLPMPSKTNMLRQFLLEDFIPLFQCTSTSYNSPLMLHLVDALQPVKALFVTKCGGLKDLSSQMMSNVYLPCHIYHPTGIPSSSSDMIEQIETLLKHLPCESSAVLMPADGILKELFTHNGAGTLFKMTEPIKAYWSVEAMEEDGVEWDRIEALLRQSFSQQNLHKDYYEKLHRQLECLYISESYSSVAIILHVEDLNVPYLDKIAVERGKQGKGIGNPIWHLIQRNHPKLFWRSRKGNLANSWYYFDKMDGYAKEGDWIIFWYGIPQEESDRFVKYAGQLTSSFV